MFMEISSSFICEKDNNIAASTEFCYTVNHFTKITRALHVESPAEPSHETHCKT